MSLSRRAALAVLATLSACDGGLQVFEDDGVVMSIDDVSPDEGPVAGGTEATLVGTGIDGEVAVWVEDVRAPYIRLSPSTLRVTMPPSPWGDVGGARLRVVSPDGDEATLSNGFTYVRGGGGGPSDPPRDTGGVDTPEDTGAPPGGGGGGPGGGSSGGGTTPYSGQTAGLVELGHLQSACPSCLGRSGTLEVTTAAVLHQPGWGSWNDWLPPLGTCDYGVMPPVLPVTTMDVGPSVTLQAAGVSIGMPRSATPDYAHAYLSPLLTDGDVVRNTLYDLVLPGGSSWGGTALVADALPTGGPIQTIQPAGLLSLTPLTFTQPLSRSGQAVSWSPPGPEFVVLDVAVFDPSSGLRVGGFVCKAADTGSLFVPGAIWQPYLLGDDVILTLYRYRTNATTLPDGSVLEAVSWFGIEGTGFIAP